MRHGRNLEYSIQTTDREVHDHTVHTLTSYNYSPLILSNYDNFGAIYWSSSTPNLALETWKEIQEVQNIAAATFALRSRPSTG